MKRNLLVVLFVSFGVSLFLAFGAERAAAQGPAGAGASTAAKESSGSSHSLNPIKWVKRDSKHSNSNANRADLEKKLTPKLQASGLLPAKSNATDACAPFTVLNECVAALHASHNLGIAFICLRAEETGVQTNADLSGCKGSFGDKAMTLHKAIHQLNPAADAKGAAKNAEQQAKDDLKGLGS